MAAVYPLVAGAPVLLDGEGEGDAASGARDHRWLLGRTNNRAARADGSDSFWVGVKSPYSQPACCLTAVATTLAMARWPAALG